MINPLPIAQLVEREIVVEYSLRNNPLQVTGSIPVRKITKLSSEKYIKL